MRLSAVRPCLALALVSTTVVGCFPDPITEVDETRPPTPTLAATPTPDENGGTPVPLDLTGTWGYKTVMTQHVENAFDSTKYDLQTITSYHVLTLSAGSSSTELIHSAQLCLSELSEVSGSIATLSPGFYTNSVPVPQAATLDKAQIGAVYTLPTSVSLRGVNLSNPNGTMPKAADPDTDCDKVDNTYMASEGVYDFDGDGAPGFITIVDGAVDADLWTIERLTLALRGTVFSKDSIRGGIDGLLEDVFICSTKPGLVSTDVDIYPEPGDEANFFIMERVTDGMSCSTLVSQKDTIFP